MKVHVCAGCGKEIARGTMLVSGNGTADKPYAAWHRACFEDTNAFQGRAAA